MNVDAVGAIGAPASSVSTSWQSARAMSRASASPRRVGFRPTTTSPASPAATSTVEKNGVLPSNTPTCGGLAGSSRARSAAARSAAGLDVVTPADEPVLGVDTAIGDVDERRQQLGDGVRFRTDRSRAAPASGGRFGELAADPQQLPGGAADRELGLLGGQEVAVHGVIDVDADAAVHVHRGVRDAVARLGRPERGVPTSRSAGRSSESRHAAWVSVSRRALMSM